MALRTPKRVTMKRPKRTPYKAASRQEVEEDFSSTQQENTSVLSNTLPDTVHKEGILSLVRHYRERDRKREEYIERLREENDFLRRINSSVLDYHNSTGLLITREGENLYRCDHSVEREGRTSRLSFTLLLVDDTYTYTPVKPSASLPDYLTKSLVFNKDQVKIFFFNVYEALLKEE